MFDPHVGVKDQARFPGRLDLCRVNFLLDLARYEGVEFVAWTTSAARARQGILLIFLPGAQSSNDRQKQQCARTNQKHSHKHVLDRVAAVTSLAAIKERYYNGTYDVCFGRLRAQITRERSILFVW